MAKFTVADAALKLGVSKEAIHNRVRRGSLKSVVENGIKLVLIEASATTASSIRKTTSKKVLHVDDRYYKLLEEQNAKLQNRVDTLEGETRSLRDQKEQMLIDERKKIEQIYKDKDEQLKSIITAISSKFMLNAPEDYLDDKEDVVEAEVQDRIEPDIDNRLISLSKYLKAKKFSKKKINKIKEKFKKNAKEDSRIITIGKKYYIDLDKYDYSDYSL
ncbi:MAG: DNA-binding protein [Epsilonproteobacteria bacterium]|nr:MAG: DNA-binding protein [Campylobacterota bacterium]